MKFSKNKRILSAVLGLSLSMAPLMGSVSALSDTIVLDEATILAASRAVLPVLGIFALAYIPLLLPTYYRYRMTMFRLIDHRRPRPLMAMRESRIMLFRNRFALLKLDLKLFDILLHLLQMLVLGKVQKSYAENIHVAPVFCAVDAVDHIA